MTTALLESTLRSKLDAIESRYAAVGDELNEAAASGNSPRLVQLSLEHARLKRTVEPYQQLRRLESQLRDAEAMLADPGTDDELRTMAEAEIAGLRPRIEQLQESLLDDLISGDDAAIESLILEIRAGTGGDEAALFAGDLLRMYENFAREHGLKWEVLDVSPSDLGGIREVVVSVKGPDVYRLLGYEGGGHRVQRVPETEAQGRIHTSAATVAVLPEAQVSDVKVDWDKDVLEHVSCAGGPGGQNVNKVASAIKLEHKATGITVSMRDERSQHKNRDRARRILLARLRDHYHQRDHAERAEKRRSMIGSGDRNERIRTYNFPQSRCTDHRINENFPLDPIIAGKLDDLVAALRRFDRQQRLKDL